MPLSGYDSSEMNRILILDDDPTIVQLVARLLQVEGYSCTTCCDSREAITLLHSTPFALVISDIAMPGIQGFNLLEFINAHFPHIGVIFITGSDDRSTAIQALKMGAFGYLIKPFNGDEMVINVVNALERRRLRLQAKSYQARLENEIREQVLSVRSREEEIAWRLVAASEYRDNETGAHVRRIGLLSEILARSIGWNRQQLDDIRLAAAMHDIGKIGVPDRILLKPGRLTSDEFGIMKRHTVIGADILGRSGIPLLNMARDIALSHHEKWDGSGYPHQIKKEDIPLAARIVTIADVYDALRSKRPYKPAFSEETTVDIMISESKERFDPQLFEAFLELRDEFNRVYDEVQDGDASYLESLSGIPSADMSVAFTECIGELSKPASSKA